MQKMGNMSQEEMKKQLENVKEICKDYCGKCPSYTGTGETKLGFCATGKSDIIKAEKGCLCPECPVYEDMGLRWMVYCTRGSGSELSDEID
ncbi:MAG: hypothetical protein BAJALOKI1v1_1650010 [Promethearchaeota archaeon]|nr:MAG: hypothetical protein BAJALOKI1v1_1650010 [Candidatus Lokiarchaeota archaeon]